MPVDGIALEQRVISSIGLFFQRYGFYILGGVLFALVAFRLGSRYYEKYRQQQVWRRATRPERVAVLEEERIRIREAQQREIERASAKSQPQTQSSSSPQSNTVTPMTLKRPKKML